MGLKLCYTALFIALITKMRYRSKISEISLTNGVAIEMRNIRLKIVVIALSLR